MTIIIIASAPVQGALDDTGDAGAPAGADHEIVADIDVRGRIHRIRTIESEEHTLEIRVEAGRLSSATGPGLDGLADDATALRIVNWLHEQSKIAIGDRDLYAAGYVADLATRIHKGEGWR